ncbi:MAG: DUF6599 family protein [bacterium]
MIHPNKSMKFNSSAALLLFLCISLSLIPSGCSEKSTENTTSIQPVDLLPASNEISGWSKGTGAGDYGEADDQSSLYDLIDGAAELYIQYGFVQGVLQNYQGTIGGAASTLSLFIADQGSSNNATALFNEELVVPSGLTPWNSGVAAIDEAVIDEALLFDIAIYLRADRFFIRIIIGKGSDEVAALNTAEDFALAIANKIG